ncbi:annexin A1-like [Macrosteles quadrilineatus]|uniref:annexin A1-like n=1 Tax=Macrosteles quadrilineatus TaxID=74068 RepID=UPI0023E33347|nr:annexin A1-like [Macrosteles quadrilineatus]
MGKISMIILVMFVPYFYMRHEDDMHPFILISELQRKYSEKLAKETEKHGRKPGPVYDGCNMCVWKYCSPSTQELNAFRFSESDDAKHLFECFGAVLTDRDCIIKILAKRSEIQRTIILNQFQQMYSMDFSDKLTDRLNKYRSTTLLTNLGTPLPLFFASQFRAGFEKLKVQRTKVEGTFTRTEILELLTSLPNCMLRKVKSVYDAKYVQTSFLRDLNESFKLMPKSEYIEVVVALANTGRDEMTSWFAAWNDAKTLRRAVKDQHFNKIKERSKEIFTTRSLYQLRDTLIIYDKLRQNDEGYSTIFDDFYHKHENAVEIYSTVSKIALDHNTYFAGVIENTLKNDKDPSRFMSIIRARCGIDLKDIADEYEKIVGESMIDTLNKHDNKKGDELTNLGNTVMTILNGRTAEKE